MNKIHVTMMFAVLICASSSALGDSVPSRIPSIETQPKYAGTSNYTSYVPQPSKRVRDEVLRISNNGSFISRCLRMITREGKSKNFETITGQDGLTFGITDFATDGGVESFMVTINKYFPQEFEEAFGSNAQQILDATWIKANNAGGKGKRANDNGLVKILWVRKGLDSILTNRHIYGAQLENFAQGKVEPSLSTFQANGFKEEFTLAAMVGIANSRGSRGMRADLIKAMSGVASSAVNRERLIVQNLLRNYVENDPHPGDGDKDLLEKGFAGSSQLTETHLGHRGRRAYMIFKLFPLSSSKMYSELGDFNLAADERLPQISH